LRENQANLGNYIPLVPDVTKRLSTMGNGVIISNVGYAGNLITFQPRGTMSQGTVTLQHNARKSEALIRTYFTGRVPNVTYDKL
jgi:hypothetical protein